MTAFLTVTKIPARRGLLGTIPSKNFVDEVEAENLDAVKEQLHIPLDGEALIVEMEHVTTVHARIVHEVIEPGGTDANSG